MYSKKILILSLSLLCVCSCSPNETSNIYYLGETAPNYYSGEPKDPSTSWSVTFENYHINSFSENELYLDFTMRMKSLIYCSYEPYRLKTDDVCVDSWVDPATDYHYERETRKYYYCDITKNIEYNGYDVFEMEDFSGEFSYTFFIKLPNTIYREQGRLTEGIIDICFLYNLCFRTCTREQNN
jgi:hypothetical protein